MGHTPGPPKPSGLVADVLPPHPTTAMPTNTTNPTQPTLNLDRPVSNCIRVSLTETLGGGSGKEGTLATGQNTTCLRGARQRKRERATGSASNFAAFQRSRRAMPHGTAPRRNYVQPCRRGCLSSAAWGGRSVGLPNATRHAPPAPPRQALN